MKNKRIGPLLREIILPHKILEDKLVLVEEEVVEEEVVVVVEEEVVEEEDQEKVKLLTKY
jgi:hypothetical protein